jgi:prolyl oligopeptidase PreP (S9A serine peptidase family)
LRHQSVTLPSGDASAPDPYLFHESPFGGHANDADPELEARLWARHYVCLARKLAS